MSEVLRAASDVASTGLALGLLGTAGMLAAARRGDHLDPLRAAVRAAVATLVIATALALLLGFGKLLFFAPALLCLITIVALLSRSGERRQAAAQALTAILRGGGRQFGARPLLTLAVAHSVGVEALRGLLRPPLSWDALLYHMLLPATWLREGAIVPIFGRHPTGFYGLAPANGELWLWWWLAPSHSELFANLASLVPWALLALATGLVARSLGASTTWPWAAAVVATLPVVVRAAATPYVDLHAASLIVAAFGLMLASRTDRRCELVPVAAALGLAAGTKVLALPWTAAAVVALALLQLGRGPRPEPRRVLAALGLLAALGTPFYLRNTVLGVGPLALRCAVPVANETETLAIAGPLTVAANLRELLQNGQLLEAFLGIRALPSFELGVGPFALVLALAALPVFASRWRDLGWLAVASQVGAQVLVWAVIPVAMNRHLFANVRYLDGALALMVAAAVAWLGPRTRTVEWLGAAVVVQSLLLQGSALSTGMRVALGMGDLGLLAILLARDRLGSRARGAAMVSLVCLGAIVAAPSFVEFRLADRERAFREEWTVHQTTTQFTAGAWGFLDQHGGTDTVALATETSDVFLVPPMGPRFQRLVTYVNVDAQDVRDIAAYPSCAPLRQGGDPRSWDANLRRAGVRWVLVAGRPNRPLPIEAAWLVERPDLYQLRYEDSWTRVYELAASVESTALQSAL